MAPAGGPGGFCDQAGGGRLRAGGDFFVAATGGKLTVDELLSELAAIGGRHGCVIQERAWNHPEIERLSGSRYLRAAAACPLTCWLPSATMAP